MKIISNIETCIYQYVSGVIKRWHMAAKLAVNLAM